MSSAWPPPVAIAKSDREKWLLELQRLGINEQRYPVSRGVHFSETLQCVHVCCPYIASGSCSSSPRPRNVPQQNPAFLRLQWARRRIEAEKQFGVTQTLWTGPPRPTDAEVTFHGSRLFL
jgi:hypothetical protein